MTEPRLNEDVAGRLDEIATLLEAQGANAFRVAYRRAAETVRRLRAPILHTERGSRQYTALFSNTARAHELGKTHDWVVIYCDGAGGEHQYTVITSERGALKGRRIVRGREEQAGENAIERRHA